MIPQKPSSIPKLVLKHLKPSDFELGCDTLVAILIETRETVEGIEKTVRDTADGAVELAKATIPLFVTGAAPSTLSLPLDTKTCVPICTKFARNRTLIPNCPRLNLES